jgi:hypothetical protein
MLSFFKILPVAVLTALCPVMHGQEINSLYLSDSVVPVYSRIDATLGLSIAYANPYDPKDIAVDALITSGSADPIVLPCFFDHGTPDNSVWKARYTPRQEGRYSIAMIVTSKGQKFRSPVLFFRVFPSAAKGFVTNRGQSNYNFLFDSGEKFRGTGANFGWEARSWEDKKYSYDYYLKVMNENKCNTIRTWMCPWNMPLEWNKVDSGYASDAATYNASAIAKADHLFNLAETYGLYVILVLDYHGALKTEADYWGGNNYWLKNPYNIINGGSCVSPADFFTNPAAMEHYKNRLRYIIARWGYSTHLLAYEFWNEIDNAMADEKIPMKAITAWHASMAETLKKIDPFDHLVTTSESHRDIPGLFEIPGIDFSQTHLYGNTNQFQSTISNKTATYGKPYMAGEFAFDWKTPSEEQNSIFEQEFHDGLWRGMFSPTPVLPLTWWWEYANDHHFNYHLKAASLFNECITTDRIHAIQSMAVKVDTSIEAYGLKVGSDGFVWVKSNRHASLSGKLVTLPGLNTGKSYVVRLFNTRAGTFSDGTLIKPAKDKNPISLVIPSTEASEDIAIQVRAMSNSGKKK